MQVPNRRQFIIGSLAACACTACPLAAALGAEAGPVDLGPATQFGERGPYGEWAKTHGFFLVRQKTRLIALSATCTHKRRALVVAGGKIKCPQHGSWFDDEGTARKGPARKPLPRLGISISREGNVVVDPSVTFKKGQWKEPGSYVNL